jgi:NAD(P)-dependent dehydrogenase (short-subunit alcohol dehydrogenase family)/rhamnose utilization protein RhaD (predicted bifunctional aldolase and dehydrogenase)
MDMKELLELSRYYGAGTDFVIAGGGNTSAKDGDIIAVKASGVPLAGIGEDGFVRLARPAVRAVLAHSYSRDPLEREAEIKADLLASRTHPEKGGRPTVETSLHEMIGYRYVVHTHPYIVNALMCSRNAEREVKSIFGDDALYLPYTDPGYTLAKAMEAALTAYKKKRGKDPRIILMQNHGLVVAADSVSEVHAFTDSVISRIRARLPEGAEPDLSPLPPPDAAALILPALRMMMSKTLPAKVLSGRLNPLVRRFLMPENRDKVSIPLTPDAQVYCGMAPLLLDFGGDAEGFLSAFPGWLAEFEAAHGAAPKILLIDGIGMVAAEDSARSARACLDVWEDLMKAAALSETFGGVKPMTPRDIEFIANWEAESYRRSVAKSAPKLLLEGKTAVVTGAAQGFGKGIAEGLFKRGANIVVADLNTTAGAAMAEALCAIKAPNSAAFRAADVTSADSVRELAKACAWEFGGLDILVSNAGVLRAGALEEMREEDFDLVTRVNYTGYFLCVKHLSPIMKLQSRFKPGYLTDIIQINSKSGLSGSNKNFAYAGSKFGGVGLTQSFALELVGHGIKVNAVCPGNLFEGPLWSDPENGLFVQYLRAGKVPGAKTIEDVRAYYEGRVPMGRGCRIEDVVKAVVYLISQEYETGQALPVTGGQEMLP